MSSEASILRSAVRLSVAPLVLYALGACSAAPPFTTSGMAAPSSSTVTAGKPRMETSCGKSVVYVTSYNNSVYIYDDTNNVQSPCGQITGLVNPQGIFVDKKGDLWVAVSGNCKTQYSSVLEFAPGNSTPIQTLQDPSGSATDVAVDNASGTVYVTNFFDYTRGCASGNNGGVEVYANGSTSPTSSLSDPNLAYAFNDAIDNKGNLYVTFLDTSGGGRIDEWTAGSGSPTDLGITLQAPGGIQTTKSGALLVCDQAVACGDFEPGSTVMTNQFATQAPGSFGVALDKHEKRAWVENPNASAGQLQEYKYPGPDKAAKQSIAVSGGGYAGVALSPAAHQGAPY